MDEAFIIQIRGYLFIITIISVVVLFVYILISSSMKNKRFKKLDDEQKTIVRKGKVIAKKSKLKNLYISVSGNKPVLVGKIEAYAQNKREVMDRNDTKKIDMTVFAVRNGSFSDYKFYCVPNDRHDELNGDVKLHDWNFMLSKSTGFFEINNNKSKQIEIDAEKNKMVDVVGLLHPIVKKSVLADPFHGKEVRKSKLIKLQNEDIIG